MGIGIFEVLTGLVILLLYLYYRLTANFDYWKKYNVKGPKPVPIFGNFKDFILCRTDIASILKKHYEDYKAEPYIGIYERSLPVLILKDLDLIKDVLVKDFHHFPDRVLMPNQSPDPFVHSILYLDYERWRPLRTNLTPVFTSSKLKDMSRFVDECVQKLENYTELLAKKGGPIECRELVAKYTNDTICSCAFGLNTDSLADEDGGFRKSGRDLIDNGFGNFTRRMLREWFPRLYAFLWPLIYNRALDFFMQSMKDTIEYRKKNNIRRNDFVDTLMGIKEMPKDKLNNIEITDMVLTAQAFIFFLGGFETSSTTIANTLYELALNPLCQDKLRKEIQEVLAKDGTLKFENIKNLKYLDKVLKEVLRKYPPGSFLRRISATSYTFKGTRLNIPKHTKILIPVSAIQMDPEIWPDPDIFDPERFDDENEEFRHPMHYLPFGDGPRKCIAMRFGVYQTKIGIATIINKFKVDVCDKTRIPYRMDPRTLVQTPLDGIHLNITTL